MCCIMKQNVFASLFNWLNSFFFQGNTEKKWIIESRKEKAVERITLKSADQI